MAYQQKDHNPKHQIVTMALVADLIYLLERLVEEVCLFFQGLGMLRQTQDGRDDHHLDTSWDVVL
jgi:hypothetical protein